MAAVPLPPFVGRKRELGLLRDHLARTLAGEGSVVLIGGEAGIGKTTLAAALCREAAERGALVLTGHCYDLSETPPYGPWIDLFSRASSMEDVALPAAFARRGTVGAVASQAELSRQVLDFLSILSARRAIVILLDDLQWSDPASLDLLRILARSASALRFLVIATYRAGELMREHPLTALLPVLVRETAAERIALRGIAPADLRMFIAARYPLPDADTDRLGAYLHARSEGNPFFVDELLRTLEAEGALQLAERGWTLGDLARIRVPPLLRQVIEGRLARLGEEAQRLLAVAAVIGQEIPLDLWMTVADTDEATLTVSIEGATEARLLEAIGDSDRMRFSHALIREALYEGIVPVRRRVWHRRIAEGLMVGHHPDPDAVAHHLTRAGDPRAAEWLIKAGERAQQSYAWVTAAERYEAALAQMAGDETTSDRGWVLFHLARMRRYADLGQSLRYLDEVIRVATAAGDRPLAAIALCDRGIIHIYLGKLGQGVDELAMAVDEIEALSPAELDLLGRQSYRGVANPALLRGSLVAHMADIGRLAEARDMGERLLIGTVNPVPESMERSSAYGDGWHGLGSVYALLGMPNEARRAYERSQVIYQDVGHHALRFFVHWIYLDRLTLPFHADRMPERQRIASEAEEARVEAASSGSTFPPHFAALSKLFIEGEWTAAETIAQESLEQPRPIYARLYARRILGFLARARGDPDSAWVQVREMFPDGPDTVPGDLLFREVIPFHHLAVMLALDAGDLDNARVWLEAQETWLAWSGAVFGRSEAHLGRAAYHRARGERAARDNAERALADASEPRQPLALLAAHRLLGELDTDAGRFANAATHFETSLALATACAAPFERALTLLTLAEFHIAVDRKTDAQASLDEVRAICSPLGARPTLARASALEARLAELNAAAPTYPAGLSAREVEVLRLLAAGKANAEIADTLFLSVNTVRIHVAHILQKTDTANRAAAASFAHRHGLA